MFSVKGLFSDNISIKIFLIFLFVIATNHLFVEQFNYFAVSDHPIRNSAVFLFIWLLSIVACLAVALIPRFWVRLILALPILISAYANELYLEIADENLELSDVTNFWLSRADYQSAIGNYWRSGISSLLYILPGIIAFLLPVYRVPKKLIYTMMTVMIYLSVYGGVFVVVMLKGGAGARGFPEQFKTSSLLLNVVKEDMNNDFNAMRKRAPKNNNNELNRPNIVLIIDESVRGDYLSINKPDIGTTPYLTSIENKIINYGYASSGTICSNYSNAILRFGASQGDISGTLLRNPSVWDYAVQTGYHTVYIDSQKSFGTFQNFMALDERRFIDEFVQFDVESVQKTDDFVRKDREAAKIIRSLLGKRRPQFIILNKEGAHAPYEGKYPSDQSIFTPHMKLGQGISKSLDKKLLINSYRNAIYWTVDLFFKELVDNLDLTNTVIIYTSDHGQNLLDRGVATHCSSNPPETVGLVPLFIITDHPDIKSKLKDKQSLFYDRASHFNIIPTILEMLNYKPASDSDPSLFEAPIGARYFYSGNILQDKDIERFELSMESDR